MKKKIIVVGGGAAGLMAAGRAAERGHEVHLYEKNNRFWKISPAIPIFYTAPFTSWTASACRNFLRSRGWS